MRHIPNPFDFLRRTQAFQLSLLTTCTFLVCIRAPLAAPLRPVLSENLCDTSVAALKEASTIRGLAIQRSVPCVVQDKPAVEGFIHETIKTELPPNKIQMEELAYKAIGLIPNDFDYGKRLIDFLVGQIGGYYDPKRKQFIMAAWLPASTQFGVAVHELTHALQDQHHDLKALLELKKGTTDSDLAMSALIEGDASAVMFDRESRASSGKSLRDAPSVDSLVLLQLLGLNLGGGEGEIPDSMKSLLVFPYTSGLRFVHALLRKGGYAEVERAYARLPQTSREILHPDEYLRGTFAAQNPEIQELPGASDNATPVYTDVLGEFGIACLFTGARTTKANSSRLAGGWIGDRLGVFPVDGGKHRIVWLTRWENEREAQEFLEGYQALISERYKKTPGETPTEIIPGTTIQIVRNKNSVTTAIYRTS